MQNHQADLISTSPQNSAAENFLHTDPISKTASCQHPFWRTPHSLRVFGNGIVTEQLQPIKLLRQSKMLPITA
jgi:hypothetical protein